MTCFLDTSALVKIAIPEPGHELLQPLLAAPIVAAEIARVEYPSALWRKHRMGEIDARRVQTLATAFSALLDGGALAAPIDLHVVATTTNVLGSAARLVARHPLRAYDAVQLASALAAAAALDDCSFGSFDDRLNDAAIAEGLPLAF